jgi:hypothetical protein
MQVNAAPMPQPACDRSSHTPYDLSASRRARAPAIHRRNVANALRSRKRQDLFEVNFADAVRL